MKKKKKKRNRREKKSELYQSYTLVALPPALPVFAERSPTNGARVSSRSRPMPSLRSSPRPTSPATESADYCFRSSDARSSRWSSGAARRRCMVHIYITLYIHIYIYVYITHTYMYTYVH